MRDCTEALQSPDRQALIDLNRTCFCFPLDRPTIDAAIVARSSAPDMQNLLAARENLFAASAVFVSPVDAKAMTTQIEAIEAAAALPAFQADCFGRNPNAAIHAQTGTRGVFMGYDFHLTSAGPRLIEINTNAGGGSLIQMLEYVTLGTGGPAADSIADMFISEWQRAGRSGSPRTIAIVDEAPQDQYLYPDFLLTKDILQQRGISTLIARPAALQLRAGRLIHGNVAIDMVYNRLTDFSLETGSAATIREALLSDAAVVSPAPRHHALYADKRNLALLSDRPKLAAWGLGDRDLDALCDLPETRLVAPDTADMLWSNRNAYFFKPATGFGSRAAYRGSKLTHRVWAEIVAGTYVAQSFVAPTTRAITGPDGPADLKFDVRVYTYAASPLLMVARAYQGQTTNFRTRGGGFAPVITRASG